MLLYCCNNVIYYNILNAARYFLRFRIFLALAGCECSAKKYVILQFSTNITKNKNFAFKRVFCEGGGGGKPMGSCVVQTPQKSRKKIFEKKILRDSILLFLLLCKLYVFSDYFW